MPDNDLVPSLLARPWRQPFRAALEGSSMQEVGDEIRLALAAALRQHGGCPGLEQLAYAARYAAVYADLPAWDRARQRFLDINGRQVLAQIMAREGDALLGASADELRAMRDEEACRRLTVGGLKRWVDECMWGRARDLLLETYDTYDRARAFERAATDSASLPGMAERLLAHPTGDGLRAPARALKPRETASLLYEEL